MPTDSIVVDNSESSQTVPPSVSHICIVFYCFGRQVSAKQFQEAVTCKSDGSFRAPRDMLRFISAHDSATIDPPVQKFLMGRSQVAWRHAANDSIGDNSMIVSLMTTH
jgi:hypothetical protein